MKTSKKQIEEIHKKEMEHINKQNIQRIINVKSKPFDRKASYQTNIQGYLEKRRNSLLSLPFHKNDDGNSSNKLRTHASTSPANKLYHQTEVNENKNQQNQPNEE